jgi:hypothetical protein
VGQPLTPPQVSATTPPTITPELREQAAKKPGEWVYAIDPEFDAAGNVPPYGVVGAWQVDDGGQIVEPFTPNPNHVASPTARGWRAARSRLEKLVQWSALGVVDPEDLRGALVESDVWVYSNGSDESVNVARLEGGVAGVFAFTDEELARATGWTDNRRLTGRELVELIPREAVIVINSGAQAVANIGEHSAGASVVDD